jgi:hypothetical protein
MIKILDNLALLWVKNANFLPNFSTKVFLKIITSAPGFKKNLKNLSMIRLLSIAIRTTLKNISPDASCNLPTAKLSLGQHVQAILPYTLEPPS